jgi:histidine triad (HIT) family protein
VDHKAMKPLDHPERKWTRASDYFLSVLDGSRTVQKIYENDWAFAFHDIGDHLDTRWEVNVVIITKKQIQTLMDLGVADGPVWLGILDCIQGVAKRVGLEEKGFTMKINVLPPYQHTPHIHLHLFSGDLKAEAEAAAAAGSAHAEPAAEVEGGDRHHHHHEKP